MDTPLDQPIDPLSPQTAPDDKGAESPNVVASGSHPTPLQEGRKQRKECRPDQTPWWKHLLELAAVLLGIAVAYIYWNQLTVMSGQLGQMESSGTQTGQLICLYQKQVEKLGEQVTKTEELARSALEQAKATNRLAGQTKRSAAINARQLNDYEAGQAAEIVIEDFTVENFVA